MYTLQKRNANTDARMFILEVAVGTLNVLRRGWVRNESGGYADVHVSKLITKVWTRYRLFLHSYQ